MASDRHPDPDRDRLDRAGPCPDAPGLSVLVVEDDADLAAGLAGWLGRCGHEARLAPDGPAALRSAEAEPPDVVLLDIGLPGMDGYAVAERIREDLSPALPKAPLVIAVTGRGGGADRRRSRAAGIDLHLTKPVDVGQLSRVLGRFQRIIR
jgi:two-component system, OmpR family, response regulator